jgi:hypothetical protein
MGASSGTGLRVAAFQSGYPKEDSMVRITTTAALALLLGTSTAVMAQSSKTTDKMTPGHQMQDKGPYKNETTGQTSPGASGYSPGHQMQREGSKEGMPGASGYAPGHQSGQSGTTGKTK